MVEGGRLMRSNEYAYLFGLVQRGGDGKAYQFAKSFMREDELCQAILNGIARPMCDLMTANARDMLGSRWEELDGGSYVGMFTGAFDMLAASLRRATSLYYTDAAELCAKNEINFAPRHMYTNLCGIELSSSLCEKWSS